MSNPGTFFEAAKLAGIRWVDLELAKRAPNLSPSSVVERAGEHHLTIRAIWLPPTNRSVLGDARPEARADLAGTLVAATGASAVIVDRSSPQVGHESRQHRLIEAIRARVPPSARLTFALRPERLAVGRQHLEDLTVLRRLAEEWDWDLALDLCGRIDPAWEAEAAVSKILPRLTVVRLGPVGAVSAGRGRERLTARVLAYLADLGYSGALAIQPSAPFWHPDRALSLARSGQDTRSKILARYEAIRDQPRIDPLRRRPGPGIEMPG